MGLGSRAAVLLVPELAGGSEIDGAVVLAGAAGLLAAALGAGVEAMSFVNVGVSVAVPACKEAMRNWVDVSWIGISMRAPLRDCCIPQQVR